MQKDNLENKDLTDYFNQIKEDLSGYISKRLELFKLSAYSKTSLAVSTIAYSLIVALFLFAIFLVLLFGLGFFFGELLNSNAAGFGILILLTVITLIIFVANGNKFKRFLCNKIIMIIKELEDDEN